MRVAVNSSPLIFLAKLGLLDVLGKLFDEVYVTDAVYWETVVEGAGREEAILIEKADFLRRASVENQHLVKFLLELIDYGEAETIALAIERKLDLVVLDDKDARKVARGFGLRVTGTLGILLLAKRRGLISEVAPYIETLKKHGFRISDEVVKEDRLRLDLYKRFSNASSLKEIYELEKEMLDRFSKLDTPTKNFIEKMKIKVLAKEQNIKSISNYAENITIIYDKDKKEFFKAEAKDDEIILESILKKLKK